MEDGVESDNSPPIYMCTRGPFLLGTAFISSLSKRYHLPQTSTVIGRSLALGQSEILSGEHLSLNVSSEESKTGLREKQAEDKKRPCGISSTGFLDSSGQKFPFLSKLVSVSSNSH